MSLLNKIEEIQKKPESYKKGLLVLVLFVFMSGVVAAWIFTLDMPGGGGSAASGPAKKDYSPVSVIVEDMRRIKDSLVASFSYVKEEVRQINEQ